jgi:hypothetical protein
MSPVRRFWPILAVSAGVALLFFEIRRAASLAAANYFWLLVGAAILILGVVDLAQSLRGVPEPGHDDRSNPSPPAPV